jgi:diaminopimelate epimerase
LPAIKSFLKEISHFLFSNDRNLLKAVLFIFQIKYFCMKFEKMQGTGNDYIYFNLFEERIDAPSTLSIKLSDRHFGVGGDGIVLIGPSDEGDFSMRMFNADGSEAEMCGNASRCVAKYLYERGLTKKREIALDTKAGIKYLQLFIDPQTDTVQRVRVNMGEASVSSQSIPVVSELPEVIDQPLIIDEKELRITCVSMGNPHAVIFTSGIDNLKLDEIGPKIENHPMFPQRTNVEFIEVVDRNTFKMRVWERGSGETLACGTGACASVVAGVLNNRCDTRVTVKLKGGDLDIEWDKTNNQVYLTGDAHFVFKGEIPD